MEITKLQPGGEAYELRELPCGSVLLLLNGSTCSLSIVGAGEASFTIRKGSVVFQAAGQALSLTPGDDPAGVTLYRAHINLGEM